MESVKKTSFFLPSPQYINKKFTESEVMGLLMGHRKPVAERRPADSFLLCLIALLYVCPLFIHALLFSFSRVF